jgi:hypothetical protein
VAASMEISLGARLSDRLCHVRPSHRPCCVNDWRGQHYARGCGIFAVPQFPSFSTISAVSGRTGFASGTTEVRAKPAIPLRARIVSSFPRQSQRLPLRQITGGESGRNPALSRRSGRRSSARIQCL